MDKKVLTDAGTFYQHYPKLTVVVTAHSKGKDNAMSAAWHTSLSRKPAIYGVVISTKRYTYQMIVDSQEFGVNFLPLDKVELIPAVGGSSGRDIDKFEKFGIAKDKPLKTKVPILKDAYVAYECKLIEDRLYGDHHFMVGEVVAMHLQKGVLAKDETLDLGKVSPIMYLGYDRYLTPSKDIRFLDREIYAKRFV